MAAGDGAYTRQPAPTHAQLNSQRSKQEMVEDRGAGVEPYGRVATPPLLDTYRAPSPGPAQMLREKEFGGVGYDARSGAF